MKQQYYLHIPIDCVDHIQRKNRSSLTRTCGDLF